MKLHRLLPIFALVIALLPRMPAGAHDHRPPQAILRVDAETQRGHRYHHHWVKPYDEDECDITFGGDLFVSFPKALRVEAPATILIRLRKPTIPTEVIVHQWLEVDDEGHAQGEPALLPWSLAPVHRQGAVVAWDIHVPVTLPRPHLYLGVEAYWADEQGCGPQPDLGSQTASWTFHARTK